MGGNLDTFALLPAILIMTAAIGIQIGIGTEIDEKARNSIPIAIAISISTVRMFSQLELLRGMEPRKGRA